MSEAEYLRNETDPKPINMKQLGGGIWSSMVGSGASASASASALNVIVPQNGSGRRRRRRTHRRR